MKYIVGYPIKENKSFLNTVIQNKSNISEVYFSWGDMPNGRSALSIDDALTTFEIQQRQASDLKLLSSEDIRLNMLFNANCYGKNAQSRDFFNKIGNLIDYISREFGLSSVTTSSILIAKFIKANFEGIDVRASVNMEIGSVEGMSYVSEYFDSFYVRRELNRNLPALLKLRKWCDDNGKEMYLLANSGCLNNCSAHIFHDNLVAHESEICEVRNLNDFTPYVCWRALESKDNWHMLLENTWVRPEDIHHYEGIFDTVKLATRMHSLPGMVIDAYARGRYIGNTLDLFEPGFGRAIAPYIISNLNFPETWFTKTSSCDKICHKCGYCKAVLEQVLINTEEKV